ARASRGVFVELAGCVLARPEGAPRDLPGDPAGDRRRLARPRAGEDADRSARRLDGGALLVVQALEDPVAVHGTDHRIPRVGRKLPYAVGGWKAAASPLGSSTGAAA